MWRLAVVWGLGCHTPMDLVVGTEAEVVVSPDGAISLVVAGRTTFIVAPIGPEVRTFREDVASNIGQWTFTRQDEATVRFRRGSVRAVADGVDVVYGSSNGPGLLSFRPDGEGATRITFAPPAGLVGQALALPARCDPDGSFHGFGEQYHATDHRGEQFPLMVSEQGIGRDGAAPFYSGDAHTTYFPMPYYLDARGFGVLVQTKHRVEVDLCASDADVAWLEVVDDAPLEVLVLHGPAPRDVVRQLGDRIGRPTAPPAWAYGTWVCAQGGDAAVRAQAASLRDAGIPATALWVQDWTGRAVNLGGGYGVNYRWVPDEGGLYPNLQTLLSDLHGMDFKVLGYVNPFVDPNLPDHYAEMASQGMLPVDASGDVVNFFGPRGEMTQADLTNPATQRYIRERLMAATDLGLDGWMADFAEWAPLEAVPFDGSDAMVAHNGAPEAWQRLSREVADQHPGDFVFFARSGWTGVQSVAQIHWVGDQEADFSETDGLPTVVPAMLSLGLSGQPFATHDVAGFSGGPSTEALYLRWIELGTFTPFFRTHDGNARGENWRFDTDAATFAFFARFAKIHDLLRPELEAAAARAAVDGTPLVQHLMLAYPDDPVVPTLSDQYLLGDDLLVAPVLHDAQTERRLYLPEGRWTHVFTGETATGPAWITVAAPIGSPPVFSLGRDRPELRAVR